MVLNRYARLEPPYPVLEPAGVFALLWLVASATTTGITHVFSGTVVAVLAIAVEVPN